MGGLTLLTGEVIPWDRVASVGDKNPFNSDWFGIAIELIPTEELVEVAVFRDRLHAYECWQHAARAKREGKDFDLRITEAESPESRASTEEAMR